jgi:hypothetical protein
LRAFLGVLRAMRMKLALLNSWLPELGSNQRPAD